MTADLPALLAKVKGSKPHRDIMRHALGWPKNYRNYFCAGDGHADMPLIRDLIDAGLMRLSHRINDDRDGIFVVTDAGRTLIAKGEQHG